MYILVVTFPQCDWWTAGPRFLGKDKLSTWEEKVSFLDPQPSVTSSYLCNWDMGQGELDQPSCVHLIMNPQGTWRLD